jgi:HK97 family phage major capsid protein
MATASELATQLTTKRTEHAAFLASFKKDGGYDMPADKVDEFHRRNDELGELQKSWETAVTVEKAAEVNEAKLAPQGTIAANKGGDEPIENKGNGRIETKAQLDAAFTKAFTDNAEKLKAMAGGAPGTVQFTLPVEAKTLVTLADHYPPADRQRTTGMAAYYGDVEDLFAPGSTSSSNIEYFIQTTNTTNAAFVAEGSAATDSAYVWTKTTDEVEEIQAWIPVTRAFFTDNDGMQSVVTGRLQYELQAEVNQQILSGTGTTPQLWGAFIRVGFQTQAKAADPAFDAVGKAILKVQVTGDAIPDAIVFHPTDWWNLKLTRTTDGIYILGNPGDSGNAFQLWGLPVRLSTGIGAAGTAGVGAFRQYAQIFNNGGVLVEASTEHSTYFTERKIAIAVSRRMSLASYRPSAFATVTGL